MSVIINGATIPKSCVQCNESGLTAAIMHIGAPCPWFSGLIWKQNYDLRTERHPDCPLVDVPPHGRLIDADADRLEDEVWKLRAFRTRSDIQELIDSAPTVIRAD